MSENITRSISGLIYIILLIGATLYSELSYQILILSFLVIGIYEFSKLTNIPLIRGFLIAMSPVLAIHITKNTIPFYYYNLFGVAILILLFVQLFQKNIDTQSKYLNYLFLIGYISIPFITLLKIPFVGSEYEPRVIIGIFILIWTNDTFAYLTGKSFGKNKLFERISPKKTIEGFLGGVLFTIIASLVISHYFSFYNSIIWISSAIFVSLFGTIGDLVESKFKRQANVKDSGKIMPGHGGILDRLDSIIFVAPFLYLIFKTFQ